MGTPIIIFGSSRSFGETWSAVHVVLGDNKSIPIIDLNTLSIAPYDYTYKNKEDDYLPLMERIVTHDLIVLATPVYWYTMSSLMKMFIDRLSDLLDIRKDIGRQLRGKRLYVVASFGTSLPKGFEEPFSQTCAYLGIIYEGCSFIYSGDDPDLQSANAQNIEKAQKILGIY
ncbi:MAG: NAD(P)H-dependent oxidoreductase [Alphaproteobacteria bacterium]|nr:NAD(P)H-dependent oxidoreductase [Alphaproteobacteria bacterium]